MRQNAIIYYPFPFFLFPLHLVQFHTNEYTDCNSDHVMIISLSIARHKEEPPVFHRYREVIQTSIMRSRDRLVMNYGQHKSVQMPQRGVESWSWIIDRGSHRLRHKSYIAITTALSYADTSCLLSSVHWVELRVATDGRATALYPLQTPTYRLPMIHYLSQLYIHVFAVQHETSCWFSKTIKTNDEHRKKRITERREESTT